VITVSDRETTTLEQESSDASRTQPSGLRRALILGCHVAIPMLLLAPLAVTALSGGDLTVLALSAIVAVLLVRTLLLHVLPWLNREFHG